MSFLLAICVLLAVGCSSMRIIHNGQDVRLVGPDSDTDCGTGRVEFYDGSDWNSFCSTTSSNYYNIAESVCKSLGFYYGYDNYYSGRSAYTSANGFTDDTEDYQYSADTSGYGYDNYYCTSSCAGSSDDICDECALRYYGYYCTYDKDSLSTAEKESVDYNYALFVNCDTSYSSRSSYCSSYTSYADFDSAFSSSYFDQCYDGSYYCAADSTSTGTGTVSASSAGAAAGVIVVWVVICFFVIICCVACGVARHRRGYYGWGTTRYGGTYGWGSRWGRSGVTPAFAAGYGAGQIQPAPATQNTTTTTTNVIVQQPQQQPQVIMQPQRPIVYAQQPMQQQQYVQQPMQQQQPMQYVQQPMQAQQPMQYAQQPQQPIQYMQPQQQMQQPQQMQYVQQPQQMQQQPQTVQYMQPQQQSRPPAYAPASGGEGNATMS